jgi:ABC-type uncharacterized transport system substrate-binding protein
MAAVREVAPFVNLKRDYESKLRLNALEESLPQGVKLKPAQYGAADFGHYEHKAEKLKNDNPSTDVFFASCWPTLEALDNLGTGKPLVYAGMVTGNTPPRGSHGIKAFDVNDLCPNWPALLKQIAPNITRVAIVYDTTHPGTRSQYERIRQAIGAQLTIIDIYADDGHNLPNSHIVRDIQENTDPGDGLIVTACTMTGVLREEITTVARGQKLITICPEQMYLRTATSCLMTYGPDLRGLYKDAATIVKQVLTGSGPGHTTNYNYKLFVNRSIAYELGTAVQIPAAGFKVSVNGKPYTIPAEQVSLRDVAR